jgi:hypothetical protein
MLKQPSGFPVSLPYQLGILSLAGVGALERLEIEDVETWSSIFYSVPLWCFLLVPVKIIGYSCACSVGSR